jgi:hypothetical protein
MAAANAAWRRAGHNTGAAFPATRWVSIKLT